MILTPAKIPHYLLGRGLITYDSVVDGDLTITEKTLRNRNFKVIRRQNPSLFLKQIKNWDQQSILTLQYEATCYGLAQNDPDFAGLIPLMPKYYWFDPSQYILVIELLDNSENLADYHTRLGHFPADVAALIGKRLGEFHREIGPKVKNGAKDSKFQKRIPWILNLHQTNPAFLDPLSAANSQLIGILQRYPEFPSHLNSLQNEYKFSALIHGDIKWENCVVYKNGGEELQVKIVDWELADIGDPCWDAGAIFQSYITFWIMSIPIAGDVPPSQLLDKAKYPIDDMLPAIKAYWSAYAEALQVEGKQQQKDLLEKSVKCGAARMIQTVYEHMNYSPQITPNAICLLQVCMNILENPKEAVTDLLGL